MNSILRNIILGTAVFAMVAILVVVALPIGNVFASGADVNSIQQDLTSNDPATLNARLELAFLREKTILNRIGMTSNNFDMIVNNVQILLDKAKSNGKDVSGIQSAFDNFKSAFQTGKPYFEQANALLAAPSGFDSNGKVIDAQKAKQTVKSIRDLLVQYNSVVKVARASLRDAVKNFRLANPHKGKISIPTATPSQN